MRSRAIAIFCLSLLLGALSTGWANSKIVQHAQLTIYIEDDFHNVLGWKSFAYSSTSPCGPTLPDPLTLWFNLEIPSQPGVDLFSDVPLIPNIGHTIWIDSSPPNPDYTAFVVALTDGRNDWISGTLSLESAGTFVSSESKWVAESDFSGNGCNDFYGQQIGRIGMRVGWASVTQEPCVPEPYSCSILLAGLGSLTGLWARRRRRPATGRSA